VYYHLPGKDLETFKFLIPCPSGQAGLFDILDLEQKKNISTIQYGRNKIDEGK